MIMVIAQREVLRVSTARPRVPKQCRPLQAARSPLFRNPRSTTAIFRPGPRREHVPIKATRGCEALSAAPGAKAASSRAQSISTHSDHESPKGSASCALGPGGDSDVRACGAAAVSDRDD